MFLFCTQLKKNWISVPQLFNLWKVKGRWFCTLFEDAAKLKLPVEIMQPLIFCTFFPILKRMYKIKNLQPLKIKGQWFCTLFEDRAKYWNYLYYFQFSKEKTLQPVKIDGQWFCTLFWGWDQIEITFWD